MLKNKNGEDVELQDVLKYLQGTDDLDNAQSVMDFAVYRMENGEIGDPQYYLIGTEVIVNRISFIGSFVSVELDFRNVNLSILTQVISVISKFHEDVNGEDVIMLSTITPLSKEANHILSLANPLVCVRGYSDEGRATTILQLIYAAENAAFSLFDVDYDAVDAEVQRELDEMESYKVTNEALEAAESAMSDDENNERMRSMFKPSFGMDFDDRQRKQGVERVSGHKDADNLLARRNTRTDRRIGLTDGEKEDNGLIDRKGDE